MQSIWDNTDGILPIVLLGVVGGLWALLAPKHNVLFSHRWMFKDPDQLEPSGLAVGLTRLAGGVACLVALGLLGLPVYSTYVHNRCAAAISAWRGEPVGEADLKKLANRHEDKGVNTCDLISVTLDRVLPDVGGGTDVDSKAQAPYGYQVLTGHEPEYVDDAPWGIPSELDDDLLIGPTTCTDVGVWEGSRSVRVWLPDPEYCASEDTDYALELVAVDLRDPLGRRTVVGPRGEAVRRIPAG